MKKMIFCIECRWLNSDETALAVETSIYRINDNVLESMDYNCRYPSNVTVKNSWLCSNEMYMKKPSEINQKNNCGWFASKYKEK